MQKIDDEIHMETREARAGDTPGVMRYVLAIGLLLAILVLSIIWMTGALSLRPPGPSDTATAEEQALGG